MVDRSRCFAASRCIAILVVVALPLSFAACGRTGGATTQTDGSAPEPTNVVLASTTSTQDSGLFAVLIPAFEKAYPQYKVEVIAVGTGEALELGKNKDADVLLVHAKAREEEFVAGGYGISRTDVMFNDFIIVSPPTDPAGIRGMTDASDAFAKIAAAQAMFVSRGDESGTHAKELAIWKEAGIEPARTWYLSAGQGMGDVLKIASETPAYTLSDRATFLALRDDLALEIGVEGDKALLNQYGVIVVTDAANEEGAQAFADWIVGDEGQAVIGAFGREEYGEQLFTPNAP